MTGKVAACAAFCALVPVSAFAHHPGGTANTGGAGPIVTLSAETLEGGHAAVAFLYEYIRFGGLGDAALVAAAAAHQHAHSIGTISSASAGASFGITDNVMLSVRLPYVTRTDIREGHHAHGHGGVVSNTVDFRGDTVGVGDMTMLGQWRFFNNPASGTQLALLIGAKLPTGATGRRDVAGALFEAEFQPGSGSFDVLLGGAITQRFGAWSFDANILYAVASTGTQDTNLGDRFQYNAAVSYRLFGGPREAASGVALTHSAEPRRRASPIHVHDRPHQHDHAPTVATPSFGVDLVLELNGEWHDRTVAAGVRDANSGGNVVYLSPGVRLSYGGVSGFASVGLPVVNEMSGLQSKPSWRLVTGLAAAF
jgi:hypothetical protein